jgi:hypothetical protein
MELREVDRPTTEGRWGRYSALWDALMVAYQRGRAVQVKASGSLRFSVKNSINAIRIRRTHNLQLHASFNRADQTLTLWLTARAAPLAPPTVDRAVDVEELVNA